MTTVFYFITAILSLYILFISQEVSNAYSEEIESNQAGVKYQSLSDILLLVVSGNLYSLCIMYSYNVLRLVFYFVEVYIVVAQSVCILTIKNTYK